MKKPLEIISEIRGFIASQNPLRFPYQEETILNLLAELEDTLPPVTEEPIIEEPILEEPVVEEPILEEPVVEEVVVKAPKRNARKK